MNIVIMTFGATGDVVRTTTLLRRLPGRITWLTAANNTDLLQDEPERLYSLSWEQRELIRGEKFDLAVNLEDDLETAQFLNLVQCNQVFGAYLEANDVLRYTDDSRAWFDLSLISIYGKEEADRLKLLNRHTYQELIFRGLGLNFEGERYLLPMPLKTRLKETIPFVPKAGPVCPMKNWAFSDQL